MINEMKMTPYCQMNGAQQLVVWCRRKAELRGAHVVFLVVMATQAAFFKQPPPLPPSVLSLQSFTFSSFLQFSFLDSEHSKARF